MASNFCVMTLGRTGSTSLIHAFRPVADVVLPSRLFPDCEDEELVHPDTSERWRNSFQAQTGQPLPNNAAFVEAYYRYFASEAYVGFKSMPQRHLDYSQFIRRPDTFFITLTRRDLPSMVASFQLAMQKGTWRRNGEPLQHRWVFTPEQMRGTEKLLTYILATNQLLSSIPQALHLTYEEISSPGFHHEALDEYFRCPIRLPNPRGPTNASSYVENWGEFQRFIEIRTAELLGKPVFIV